MIWLTLKVLFYICSGYGWATILDERFNPGNGQPEVKYVSAVVYTLALLHVACRREWKQTGERP